jgi:GntR family transcriptional regulator/MocR family aminotransferase
VRGALADPERVVVSAGLAHGLTLLWHTLRDRGIRRVAVEDPSWLRQRETLGRCGLAAVPVRVDERGLVVAELETASVEAAVVTPAHQYPTGVVLAPERRAALVDWARRRDALIVEDDYDAEYRYDREPVAALQGLGPDCVVYAGTASKSLAPALRIAWLLLPDHLLADVARQSLVTGATPGVFEQAALAHLLDTGELDRHLRRTRRLYRSRRDALARALSDALPRGRIGGAAAGLHLVAWLPSGTDDVRLADAILARGLAVDSLHRDCALSAPWPPALLLGYAALPERTLALAARELAAVVS